MSTSRPNRREPPSVGRTFDITYMPDNAVTQMHGLADILIIMPNSRATLQYMA